MHESEVNRREFVFGLAGAAAGAWLATHLRELRATAAYAASVAPEQPYEFFTPEEAREFDAISAQIVPTDETPGAREAHVVRFVDRYLATVGKDEQPDLQDDFKLLGDAVAKKTSGSRSFAALSAADQIAFLTELEKSHHGVFADFRGFTMLGMFSDPIHGGNFNKVGWKLIGFDPIPYHARVLPSLPHMKTYSPTDKVDFVIVGSGAAGGVMAHELARSGFSVVVLEQGPWLTEKDFSHDTLNNLYHPEKRLDNALQEQPQTRRANEVETARKRPFAHYGRVVGGGTVHFGANYWRFPEIEFEQASRLGIPDGSSVADWPITYQDLEPYYTKVDWEIGVSGKAGNPFEAPRSKGYPVAPLPNTSGGALCERGAKRLGWHAWPSPMAILSRPYRGRAACVQCGFCQGYGCEVQAKSSTLVAMIPGAVATARCEIRPHSYVRKIEMGPTGRVTGVTYFDKDKKEVFQSAKAVVLSANGVETPKLLLLSATGAFPDGLANSSGEVGRNFMNNMFCGTNALFDHETNGRKGVGGRMIFDFLQVPKGLGLYGGGGLGLTGGGDPGGGSWPGEPTWGREWKKRAKDYFNNMAGAGAITTQLPVSTNRVDLDPREKDAWGLPVPRLTFTRHPLDTKLGEWFGARTRELLQAAGAAKVSESFGGGQVPEHLLGTCRMGKDPRMSVVDADHRAHDVPNLFIVDGSSFVTSGPAPTMTIQALAFRAADRITQLAKARSI